MIKNKNRGVLLYYTGSKKKAVDILTQHIPKSVFRTKQICSPFCGALSFEMHLVKLIPDLRVYASDNYAELINFLSDLKSHPTDLRSRIYRYSEPLTDEQFERLDVKNSADFFVKNRCMFGGVRDTTISRKNANVWKSRVKRIDVLNSAPPLLQQFVFRVQDFKDAINDHPGVFLFLDPPYMIEKSKNHFYGEDKFDHQALCDILSTRRNWMLCYNNSSKIINMYKKIPGTKFIELDWYYPLGNKLISQKKPKEILIMR